MTRRELKAVVSAAPVMTAFQPSMQLKPLLTEPSRPFVHRDLSWLQFNSRVLEESFAKTNPSLERLKFLSISASNLDEFFMIRLSSLGRAIAKEEKKGDRTQVRRLTRIRSAILESISDLSSKQAQALDAIATELRSAKIFFHLDPLETESGRLLGKLAFEQQILHLLEPPQAYRPAQLCSLENGQLAVVFDSKRWIKIPKHLANVLSIKDPKSEATHFFFLDRLLLAFCSDALKQPSELVAVRLTRDADIPVDFEHRDLGSIPEIIKNSLIRRERGRPVRLQYVGNPSIDFIKHAQAALRLKTGQIFQSDPTCCLNGLWRAQESIPEKTKKSAALVYPPAHQNREYAFEELKSRDILFHHPYDSFESYVDWIRAACEDPAVISIEQTIYRMDALSTLTEELKKAAKEKRVRVVIELRARFDEKNNLALANELRQAGVDVAFGFGRLKLHAKVALVTRMEEGNPRLYTHLSTGNYNSATARQYTDLAILTANAEIGEDARHFFDSLQDGKVPQNFKCLVAAPTQLHRKISQLIESEITAAKEGKSARIFVKVNALVDEEIIARLYEASNAGVKIDLIVRGACSLIPGVKGLSENVRVLSLVDRYLEHSRIYHFESSKTMYLSSADWMPRNFFSRLELAFPVLDPRIYDYISRVIIPVYLADTVKAAELTADGVWRRRSTPEFEKPIRSQFQFEELARDGYRGTPLSQKDRK